MSDKEQTSFSECLKEMQKKCSHPEVEEFNGGSGGENTNGVFSMCMCCGKVLKIDVEKLLNNENE